MKFFGHIKNISILSYFKTLIKYLVKFTKELIKTFSYVSSAIFWVFDLLVNIFIRLFSYIFYGLKYIGEFTVKLGYYVYNYFLKYIFSELYYLFLAVFVGGKQICKTCFYEFPLFLVRSLSNFFNYLGKKFKNAKERLSYFNKNTPTAIKDYFENKWNNLSVVKHYRNKKERELEILLIDKFGKDAERTEKKLTYQYLARNSKGKLIKGYFAALSKLDVHSYLLDNGYEVYEIKTNWLINFLHGESITLSKRMSNKNLIYWLAQLSTYLKAGIPLTEAVKLLSEQDSKKKNKKVYASIIYELSMGESFSEALNKQGNVFPPLLINMIKAAELIGDLEGTLDEMSKYYEEKEITRKQMISALTYPSIILVLAVIIISFMVIYIVPQFKKVYDSMNAQMNGVTLFLLDLSDFLRNYFGYLIFGIIGAVILLSLLYKKVKAFRTVIQYFYMHIPVIGKLVIYNEMNLFAKTFAVLNKNNILLTDSMDILSKITNNEFYKMIMYDTISNLLRGEKISLSFKDNWAVPPLAYYMITTGEQTGELSSMLEKVSEYYQREQRSLANTLKTLIEPLLIAFLAIVVGGIMVSILVPMYTIGYEVLGG